MQIRRPLGITLLVAFFCFAVAMCGLTAFLLLFPGTSLDVAWQVKPAARDDLMPIRSLAIVMMLTTGAACGLAAIGLARGRKWGRVVAIAVLAINAVGDLTNALAQHDWRTLIGLPISGLIIAYLFSVNVKRWTTAGAQEQSS